MHYTDLPSSWSETLEKLGLHTGHAQPPTGAHSPWYAAIMRFGKRGFFMVFLDKTTEGRVAMRLELSHPAPEQAAAFSRELGARLEALGMRDAEFTHEQGAPALLDLTSSEQLDQSSEKIDALLLLLMKVGDYICALDQDPDAPSPLTETTAALEAPVTTETPAGFEVIGAREATPPEQARSDAPAPASSAFESIGSDTPAPRAPAEQAPAGEVSISRHDVRARQDHVLLEIDLSRKGRHDALTAALEHMLRTRFDADVTLTEAPSPESATLRVRIAPGLTTATDRDRDALEQDVKRYIKKLQEFSAMGVPLGEILGVSEGRSSSTTSTSQRTERATRRDIPSRRDTQPSTRVEEEPSTGFVLGLGSSQRSHDASPSARTQDPEHTLTPGDFTDTRLRREDATGPLVDLVLRHPGYSDRNMSKVLTLLLSIEYSQAMALIEKAPCVLSWGIGRERAQTMKSVIEGAGGKVVMVEPDTFAAS